MGKIKKTIFFISVSFTILSIVSFVFFTTYIFIKHGESVTDFLGVLTGIAFSLTFGLWISFVFYHLNDKNENNYANMAKEKCCANLKRKISTVLIWINANEEALCKKFPILKRSFSDNGIDFKNLVSNYFILINLNNRIDEFNFEQKEKESIKNLINILFINDTLDKDITQFGSPSESKLYNQIAEIKEECRSLIGIVQDLNNTYKRDVFSKEEIHWIKELSDFSFFTFYFLHNIAFPKLLLDEVNKIIQLNLFLHVDHSLPYRKPDYPEKLSSIKTIFTIEKDSEQWLIDNNKQANDILDNYKTNT